MNGVRYDDPQTAFNAAAEGDTVYICPGTYDWMGAVVNKKLTFRGSARDASRVVLDGLWAYRLLLVTGDGVTLQDITFYRGMADGDTGGAIYGFGSLLVEDCVFDFDSAEYEGGAIRMEDTTSLVIRRSTFTNNFSGTYGGAIYVNGEMDVTIEDSTFSSNTVLEGGGGAIAVGTSDAWTIDITGSTFHENLVEHGEGGAITRSAPAGDDVATVAITDSTFDANEATNIAAISLFGHDVTLALVDTVIRDSVVDSGSKSSTAIQAFGGTALDISFDGCSITANHGPYQAVNVSWSGTTLTSVNSDWGAGPKENEGGDLISRCGVHDDLAVGESFTCTPDGVWSEP